MNKREISRQYGILFACLTILSVAVLLITPFMTAFKLDLGFFSGSEKGIDYLGELFEFDSQNKSNSSEDSNLFGGEESGTLIEGFLGKLIMCGFVIGAFIGAISFLCWFLSNRDVENHSDHFIKYMKSFLWINAGYFLFCELVILKEHDWAVADVLSGDALIKTSTFTPLLLQIVILVVACFLDRHMIEAMEGLKKPISIPFFSTNTTMSTAKTSKYSEQERVELLSKYKDLLDNQVITEEEFNTKKAELLNDIPTFSPKSDSDISYEKKFPNQETRKFESSEDTYKPPMKWYKFLVSFALIAGSILNALSGILAITGAQYNGAADAVYRAFPDMQTVDFFYGIALIGLAALGFATRHALNWYKKKGPKMLVVLYELVGILSIAYMAISSVILGQSLFNSSIIATLVTNFAMAIINANYFKKRSEMFKC